MKTSLWIVIVVVAGFLGFVIGSAQPPAKQAPVSGVAVQPEKLDQQRGETKKH
jgi:hypothetical protein